MRWFEFRNDVEDWLDPLTYEQFWAEGAPYDVAIPQKATCDREIAAGTIDEAATLRAMKALAAYDLAERYNLKHRPVEVPRLSLH